MRKRRRIILLFGAGIVLPSLLLGYLAFRGIQNDRALLEKERLEETRRAADRILKQVDDGISALEAELSKIVADHSGKTSLTLTAGLEELAAGNPLIEQVFNQEGLKAVHFPVAKLLYVPDGRRDVEPSPGRESNHSADLRTGERLEFQEKNYPRALAAYRRALGRSEDPLLTGTILNAMARVQRKSGLLDDAIAAYERIVRDHGNVVIPGGMPLGPSAALEICTLAGELGESEKSLGGLTGFYRSLLEREWRLEKAEFDFFVSRGRKLIEGLLAGRADGLDLTSHEQQFEALKAEEIEARESTERLLAFQAGAAPALEARTKNAGPSDAPKPGFARLALDIGDQTYLVSVQRRDAQPGRAPDSAWGIIVDAARLGEDVLRPALSVHLPAGETSWAVKSRDGTVLMTSGEPAPGPAILRTNFSAGFPDWSLEFQQAPAHLIKTFLLSRRGLYSFVFLLIAGILVFGLVLTIRSVSHELELARMKSDFVSTVSHEFKSPLTSIRQLAEMLQAGRVPSEERRQKYYDVLLEQSERLTLLTDNILSLAKIEEGRAEFTFETTDIRILLTEVVSSFQERVRHEGFEIVLDVEGVLPALVVDRTALAQAVTNLLDNAVKYSGDSRIIETGVSLEENTVAIAVRDFGVGIKEEDLERVFERFYRGGDALTRTVKGSGLGLTLVKEIVEAHGGRISAVSESGRGSTFSIRLPLPRGEGEHK